jgi:hypothetical protein
VLCDDLRVIGIGPAVRDTRQVFSISGNDHRVLAQSPELDLRSLEQRDGRATWLSGEARDSTRCR